MLTAGKTIRNAWKPQANNGSLPRRPPIDSRRILGEHWKLKLTVKWNPLAKNCKCHADRSEIVPVGPVCPVDILKQC